MPIPIVTSLAEISAPYDALIVDIWGVLHNGVAAFPGAPEALVAFRRRGGRVVLLTNAPRPAAYIGPQLDRVGVPRDAYDVIVTSGDLARRLVTQNVGRTMHHIGPERDLPLFEDLPCRFVPLNEAEVIVCTGLFDDTRETPDDYRERLAPLAARGVPMICANPDMTVERGGVIIYCGGAIGHLYGSLSGSVTFAGKPYLPIYDMAMETVAGLIGRPPERSRLLAIGDGLKTDIPGAHAAGLPVVFVASRIHVSDPLTPALVASLFPEGGPLQPVAAMPALA